MIRRLLFVAARSRFASFFIGFAFARLTWLMPLQRILENDSVVVFAHPQPFWDAHWLAVPKKRVPSIAYVAESTLVELLKMIQAAACKLDEPVILVNAGAYQDVPQLHFHVTSGPDQFGNSWRQSDVVLSKDDSAESTFSLHPEPIRAVHWLYQRRAYENFLEVELSNSTAGSEIAQALMQGATLAQKLSLPAYTLLWAAASPQVTVHLLAGEAVQYPKE